MYHPRAAPYRRPYGQPYPPRAPPPRSVPQAVYGARPEAALTAPRHPFFEAIGNLPGNKRNFTQVDRHFVDICSRFRKHAVPQDFILATCHFATSTFPQIPLDVNFDFHLKEAGTTVAVEKTADGEVPKARHFVRVMILNGAKKDEDDKASAKVHLSRRLQFLLQKSPAGSVSAIGGEWTPADGKVPNDEAMRKTALRCARENAGLDLSQVKHWHKFMEFSYRREGGEQTSHTVVWLPAVWEHFTGDQLRPTTLVREETKEVTEEVEEEVDGEGEDKDKKKTVKKKVTITKKVPVPVLQPTEMPLASLLDMDTRTATEELMEVCLFADSFDEMLQRNFGREILKILQAKKAEAQAEAQAEKKRKREAEEAEAAKKQKTAEEEE
eukprot:RCo031708